MRIFVHPPNEVISYLHKFISLPYGSYINIEISAKSYRSDEALQGYSPHTRKCYFEGERILELYSTYSKSHCELECLTNATIKACGCVKFWLPRNKTTRICKYSELWCYSPEHQLVYFNEDVKMKCNCYPACNIIKYSAEMRPFSMNMPFLSRIPKT